MTTMPFPKLYDGPGLAPGKPELPVKDVFASGAPAGVTIHDTAGPTLQGAIGALQQSGFGYHLIIDRDGLIHQVAPFSGIVWHAGNALWNGKSPNRTHIAVSLVSWGELKMVASNVFKSWTGKVVDNDDVVLRPGNLDDIGRYWDAATPAQEQALMTFLDWAIAHGIAPKNVCGHDECALPRGRKPDPGGVIPWRMRDLRSLLVAKHQSN